MLFPSPRAIDRNFCHRLGNGSHHCWCRGTVAISRSTSPLPRSRADFENDLLVPSRPFKQLFNISLTPRSFLPPSNRLNPTQLVDFERFRFTSWQLSSFSRTSSVKSTTRVLISYLLGESRPPFPSHPFAIRSVDLLSSDCPRNVPCRTRKKLIISRCVE